MLPYSAVWVVRGHNHAEKSYKEHAALSLLCIKPHRGKESEQNQNADWGVIFQT